MQLSTYFASWYQESAKTDKAPSTKLQTHCKRELMQVAWRHLMDTAFVKACTDGMTILCSDGTEWVFFLHIMTYSADYPEKWVGLPFSHKIRCCMIFRALLATIKNLGNNPCPCCLIQKVNIHNVGMPGDAMQCKRVHVDNISRCKDVEKAHKALYQHSCKITSTQVQNSLTSHSMIPTWASPYHYRTTLPNTVNRMPSQRN